MADCPPINVGPGQDPDQFPGGTGGSGNATCVDLEVTCWVDPGGPTDEILYFQQVYDCSIPGAPVLVSSVYLDPLTLTVFDPIVAGWTPSVCPSTFSANDPETTLMWRRTVVTAGVGGAPDLVSYVPFVRVQVYDAAGNIIATNDHFYDGTVVPAAGPNDTDIHEPDITIESLALCEYDSIAGQRIGEFIRRWHIEAGTGNLVDFMGTGALFEDYDLDGSTPYVLTPGTITRQCENEVDCDNDPCVSGLDSVVTIAPGFNIPSLFNGNGFTSFQFDAPPTGIGSPIYKVDIFDGGTAGDGLDLVGTNGFETGRLIDWLMSGPGGDRPPSDEIFVIDIIGGPGGAPVNLPPATNNFQAAAVPFVIPGWAVEERGVGWIHLSSNPGFVNLIVDLTIQNPQRCDLTAIDLDPVNDPGVSIQTYLDNWSTVIDDHFTPLAPVADPNLAFEVGLPTGSADVTIYKFNSGNPVASDSVVLCQTVLDNIVCFDGEDEPLQSITALNPNGQVVFGPFFRRLDDGAFVVPQGAPTTCEAAALAKYEATCGTCGGTFTSQFASPGSGSNFDMGQTNTGPIRIMRFVNGTLPIADDICTWYNTPGNETSVFVANNINGGVWANRPIVIPHWAITNIDCTVPGQVGLFFLEDNADLHPNLCDLSTIPDIGPLWNAFLQAQQQQFSVTGHPLATYTFNEPVGNYQIWDVVSSGGPALRIVSCDPTLDGGIAMCDRQTDGTVVEFRRFISIDVDGVVTTEDRLYDGSLYTVQGSEMPAESLCRFTDPDACVSGTACVGVVTDNDVWTGLSLGTDGITPTVWSLGVGTGINVVGPQVTGFVDTFMACAQGGGVVVLNTGGVFGEATWVIGGAGLTNVVQNGPDDWTFDMDANATLADLQVNCPAALGTAISVPRPFGAPPGTLATAINDHINSFILGGFSSDFLDSSPPNTATQYECVTRDDIDISRNALIVTPCDPVECVSDCDYTNGMGAQEPAIGSNITMDIVNFDTAGDTSFTIQLDLTNEPGWLAAIQAWVARPIQVGDILVLDGVWSGTVSGVQETFWIGAWNLLATPLIIGNQVTFTFNGATHPPCRQAVADFGGGAQPLDFEDEVNNFVDALATEYLAGGSIPTITIDTTGETLFQFGPGQIVEAQRTVVCGTAEVDQVPIDVHPAIFQDTGTTTDLSTLGASAYSIEVVSGVVTLDGVILTVGRVYEFSIDGGRGKLHNVGPFNLDTTAGGVATVWYTRSH